MADEGTEEAHSFFRETYSEHKKKGGYAGGSCLTGHESAWRQRNSCSYRWQGIQRAKDKSKKIYNHKDYPKWHLDGSGFGWAAVSNIVKGRAGKILDTLKEAVKKKTLKRHIEAKNFTTGFAPYGNQVHHIVPNNVLSTAIEDATASKVDLIKDLCDGLLHAKYNINFKPNMIILPTKDKVCCILGLPKHLGSHPTYDTNITARVNEVVEMYSQKADKKKHKAQFGKIARELDEVAGEMYDSMIDYGQTQLKNQCAIGTVNALPQGIFPTVVG